MMINPKFAAAFFDLDGTLVDTGPPHRQAELQTLNAYGIPEIAPDHPVTFGKGVMPGVQLVAEHYGIEDQEALLAEYVKQWHIVTANGIEMLPGARDAVTSAVIYGASVALVTSGDSKYANTFIEKSGLAESFSTVVTLDDVANMKPHPEPYLTAAENLGIQPGHCLVFEDSETGFVSTRAAGMTSVGVGAVAIELSESEERGPDMAIESFVGFDIWGVRPR